jgi:hypothetical protein
MIEENKQVAVQNNDGFMVINTLDEALRIAEIIAKSSFCPKAFVGKPGDVLVCMQMGKEVGLKPLQSLQNIAVINGRPSLWGDGMLAVCRQASNFDYIHETFDEVSMTATCKAKRHGEPEVVRTFSRKDAEVARLWGKEGPWKNYPNRMLQMRARGFCLRDAFADALRGIISSEEADDYPTESRTGYSKTVEHVIVAERVENSTPPVVNNNLIDQYQLETLKEKIKASGSDESKLLQYMKLDALNMVTLDQFKELNKILDNRLAHKARKESPINKAMREAKEAQAQPVEADPQDTTVSDFFAEGETVDLETGEVKDI